MQTGNTEPLGLILRGPSPLLNHLLATRIREVLPGGRLQTILEPNASGWRLELEPGDRWLFIGNADSPDQAIAEAIAAGASAAMSFRDGWQDLERALIALVRGDYLYVPERILRTMGAPSLPPPPARIDSLTSREQQVLQLVVAGYSNTECARRLAVSVHTVRTHLRSIFDKLNVSSRSALARQVKAFGLLAQERGSDRRT